MLSLVACFSASDYQESCSRRWQHDAGEKQQYKHSSANTSFCAHSFDVPSSPRLSSPASRHLANRLYGARKILHFLCRTLQRMLLSSIYPFAISPLLRCRRLGVVCRESLTRSLVLRSLVLRSRRCALSGKIGSRADCGAASDCACDHCCNSWCAVVRHVWDESQWPKIEKCRRSSRFWLC